MYRENSRGTKNNEGLTDMGKITIITLQNVRNYGSVLQALATQHVFEEMGLEVDFINYYKKGRQSLMQRMRSFTEGKGFATKLIAPILLIPSFVREDKVFMKFLRKHLKQQEKVYTCMDDFKDFPITSDVYCTGSDQTWNSGWNKGILPELFLQFVPDNVKKIAYAASLGKNKLDDWELEETKALLARYQHIRHLTDYQDFSFVEHTVVDFNKVNQVLESERIIGLNYLEKALDMK